MTTQIFRDSAADRTFRAKWWTGRVVIYGLLKITLGLKLSPEEEYDGADLSIHKISATPDREVSW